MYKLNYKHLIKLSRSGEIVNKHKPIETYMYILYFILMVEINSMM